MGILYSLLAIVGDSLTTIIGRASFKKTRIAPQQFMATMFAAMLPILVAFIAITHQPFPHITLAALGLVMLIAVVSFTGNVLDYFSLKVDDLSLREPLADFEPVIAGMVGYLLFPAERKPVFLPIFLLSALIVYWGTHRRKLHKRQGKGMLYMLLAVSLYGLLPSIYKVTLDMISPTYITVFRVASILLLSAIFFPRTATRKLTGKKLRYAFLSGTACCIGAIAGLYAISSLGVVVTMLLMMIGPFMRYAASYFVLKESVHMGEMAASAMLTAVIVVGISI